MPRKRKRGSALTCRKKYNRQGRTIIQQRIDGEIVRTKNTFQTLPSVRKTEQEQSDSSSRINPNE